MCVIQHLYSFVKGSTILFSISMKSLKYPTAHFSSFLILFQFCSHDLKLTRGKVPNTIQGQLGSWGPTQQFGVTIEWIASHQHQAIPPIMTKCIDFLSSHECLEVEGIFRWFGSSCSPFFRCISAPCFNILGVNGYYKLILWLEKRNN